MRRQMTGAKQPSRSVKYGRVLADMAYRWPCFSVADFPVGRAFGESQVHTRSVIQAPGAFLLHTFLPEVLDWCRIHQ